MANLSGIQLDPKVEVNKGGNFEVFPDGDYEVVILKDAVVDNKARTGRIWKLKLQIIKGQFVGKTLDDNINLTNPSDVCQRIGQGTLRNICEITGVAYPPNSTDGILGKPLGCHLVISTFKSNRTGKELQSNNVTAYFPANEVQPEVATADTTPDINSVAAANAEMAKEDIPW